MQRPEAQRVIALLAALGRQTNFSIVATARTRGGATGRSSVSCCANAARRC